jgi:hypothetical protein
MFSWHINCLRNGMRATYLAFVSVFLAGAVAQAQGVQPITISSAASGANSVAADSIASIYGQNFTNQTQSATILPLPASLAVPLDLGVYTPFFVELFGTGMPVVVTVDGQRSNTVFIQIQ